MLTVSRRAAVLAALGSVALAGAGGLGSALYLEGPAQGMTILNREELSVIAALCEVWFPAGVFPVDGIEAGVPAGCDRVVQDIMGEVQRAGFRYVLRTLEWSTIARWGRRFTELTIDERMVVLGRWGSADVVPRRAAMDAVRIVVAIPYFRHPEVVQTIGWRTGCSGGAT